MLGHIPMENSNASNTAALLRLDRLISLLFLAAWFATTTSSTSPLVCNHPQNNVTMFYNRGRACVEEPFRLPQVSLLISTRLSA